MFTALIPWLNGGALYLWLTALIFFRCTFLSMSAEDFTPLYWINMAAISALAGAPWAGVFPLGRYSVCTNWLAKILGASFLMPVSYTFMIVALAAGRRSSSGWWIVVSRRARGCRCDRP